MNIECQLDMFDGNILPESEALAKVAKLEKQQDNLRKGLFKRYSEHENKFNELTYLMKRMIEVLSHG